MKIDAHSHFLPREVIEEIRKNGERYNSEVVVENGREFIVDRAGTKCPVFEEYYDYDRKVSDLDKMGIDMAVLSVVPNFYYYWIDAGAALNIAQICNDWVADFCRKHPDRFRGMADIPMQDPELALSELRRAHETLGLNALAMTMFSGTSTALLYDSLKQEGCEEEYIQVSANGSQISMLANAIGSMASILNRFLGYAGFYLLNAAFEGASALANMLLAEPIVTESQASREKHPLHALPEQFRQLVQDSLHVLRTCPMAVKLIASSALISVPSYLTKMFLQQRLVELGWPTELLFLPLLLGGLACVAGTEIGRRVRCRSMRRLYTACALLCGVGTLLVGAAPAWGGILGMMLVQGVLEVYLLHESQKLNDAIPSDQRATLISVDGMAYSLLMIPASPLVGAVGDAFGQAGAGLALLGGVIVLSGVALLRKKPQES